MGGDKLPESQNLPVVKIQSEMKQSQMDNAKVPVNVVVIGSINCDLTTYLKAFPLKNQTAMAEQSILSIGGKGVNQAVAAAREGANVSFIGCVGNDMFADKALGYLHKHRVNTDCIRRVDKFSTGTASILVTNQHDNMIAVAPGANCQLTVEDVNKAEQLISRADVIIVQLEVPSETVKAALLLARKYHILSVFNPAPATDDAKSLYSLADIVTPNETEAAQLTGVAIEGVKGASQAGDIMLCEGVNQVVITLGGQGCYICSDSTQQFIPPFDVEVKDPTGAGDVFNGVLAVGRARGIPLQQAVIRASAAAALSVSKPLAQDAAPATIHIDQFLQSNLYGLDH